MKYRLQSELWQLRSRLNAVLPALLLHPVVEFLELDEIKTTVDNGPRLDVPLACQGFYGAFKHQSWIVGGYCLLLEIAKPAKTVEELEWRQPAFERQCAMQVSAADQVLDNEHISI